MHTRNLPPSRSARHRSQRAGFHYRHFSCREVLSRSHDLGTGCALRSLRESCCLAQLVLAAFREERSA
jgi:hypothetical protein